MTDKKTDIRRLAVYLAFTFAVTFAGEIILLNMLEPVYQQFVLMGAMLIPMLGTLVACGGLTKKRAGIDWALDFKKKFGWLILAWFAPALFVAAGAVIYFLIFPNEFTTDYVYLKESFAMQGVELENGKIQGMTLEMLAIISIVECFTIAPAINAVLALGEEIGWRGFMTPVITRYLGRKAGLVVSGVIWGLWHAPLIAVIGYEYGTGYFGFPWTGILLFCVVTTALGICHSFVYERSGSIIVPAVLHGAFNAAATIPLLYEKDLDFNLFLGPAPVGVISVIPIAVAAVLILSFSKEPPAQDAAEEEKPEGGETPSAEGENL